MKLEEYTSLEEKKTIFGKKYRRIDTHEHFDSWFKKNHGHYFRGVNEARYKNYTSAQRLYITHNLSIHGITVNDLVKRQLKSLKTVRGGLIDDYFTSLLKFNPNDLLLLSFAQHMRKGIAPLLDFTLDARVALFFMTDGCKISKIGNNSEEGDLSSIEDYASLYYLTGTTAIAYKKVIDGILPRRFRERPAEIPLDILKHFQEKNEKLSDTDVELYKKLVDNLFMNRRLTFLNKFINDNLLDSLIKDIVLDSSIKEEGLPVVTLSNLNITAQKGCFVYHNNELIPFERLYCVDIHKSLVPYICKNYLTANGRKGFKETISRQTVYPNAETVVDDALNDALSNLV